MVAQASGAAVPPDMIDSPQFSRGGKKKQRGQTSSWMSAAKSKATGTLRRTLFGKPSKSALRARDAEDVIEEEDYTSSNYDTVRSLPASGHYGGSRVGHLHVNLSSDERLNLPPAPPVIILKLPKRRQSQPSRISPSNRAQHAQPDPVFDFQAWHSSLDDNCQDAVYSLFMRAHKCYDLIPTSTKLVVFDTHLPVRKAFFALVYNGVRAAPLWDSGRQKFVGMLTITDFIKILVRHYDAGDTGEKMRALEEEEISHWREQFAQDGCLRPLVSIDPNDSLHRAVQVLCESKVHRLPVLDRTTGNISYILTHKRLMKFLSLYMYDLPKPPFMDKSPRELGIGSWGDILTIRCDTPLHDALEIFLKNRVSALPLVDESGRVVDIYAKFDVISLAAEKSYDKLDCTVQEALAHRSDWFEGVQCCRATDSLFSVMEAIVKAEVHRLIVTDEDKKVVGIISLSDILKYLVLDPVLVESQPASNTREDSPVVDDIPEGIED
ncbi:unnamed protein product [Auanema sp. JU1783]|nr:unnamed protein product [Auanema sp. JU1783]